MKTLLVENNYTIREVVKDWLVDERHSVDLYLPNGMSGVGLEVTLRGDNRTLAGLAPNYGAYILDRETFGIDGEQFRDAVSKIIATQYAGRIIVTTNLGTLTNPERAQFGERVHWVDKPYQIHQLEAALH